MWRTCVWTVCDENRMEAAISFVVRPRRTAKGHLSLAGGEAQRRQDIAAIREPARLDQHEIPRAAVRVPEAFGPETIDLAPLGIDHVERRNDERIAVQHTRQEARNGLDRYPAGLAFSRAGGCPLEQSPAHLVGELDASARSEEDHPHSRTGRGSEHGPSRRCS
jgi:hypothetical protein